MKLWDRPGSGVLFSKEMIGFGCLVIAANLILLTAVVSIICLIVKCFFF